MFDYFTLVRLECPPKMWSTSLMTANGENRTKLALGAVIVVGLVTEPSPEITYEFAKVFSIIKRSVFS